MRAVLPVQILGSAMLYCLELLIARGNLLEIDRRGIIDLGHNVEEISLVLKPEITFSN
jgi:Ethanolamine utilization protein EutJ (predicted chaperonin)